MKEMENQLRSPEDLWSNVPMRHLVESFGGRILEEAGIPRGKEFNEQMGELETPGLLKRINKRILNLSEEERAGTRERLIRMINAIAQEEGSIKASTVKELVKIFENLASSRA